MADHDDHVIQVRATRRQEEVAAPFWQGIAFPVQLAFGVILILLVLFGYWRGRP